MNFLHLLLIGLGSTYALWILYIAVMGLKRVRDDKKLSKTALVLGYPILIIGYILDFLVNVFVMTPLLIELPQELTVTSRLKRHNSSVFIEDISPLPFTDKIVAAYNNILMPYRKAVVAWAEPLLDPFDPSGNHI